jgi:hypothetical protein
MFFDLSREMVKIEETIPDSIISSCNFVRITIFNKIEFTTFQSS